jgi:hypothetical protein
MCIDSSNNGQDLRQRRGASQGLSSLCFAALAVMMSANAVMAQQNPPITETGRLTNRNDVQAFFQQLVQDRIRRNIDRLIEIDETYKAAVQEVGAENSRRLNALLEEQRAALDELRHLDLPSQERARRTREIQAELAAQRAALSEWFVAEHELIRTEHTSGRETQRSLHDALLARIQAEQRNLLANVADGPVDVEAVLAAVRDNPPALVERDPLPVRPGSPEPVVQTPDVGELPREPLEAQVTTEVDARVNARAAPPDFDIALYAVGEISFSPVESDGIRSVEAEPDSGVLLAETMYLRVTIANRGARTFAFDGNRIEAKFVEGFFEPGQSGLESSDTGLEAIANHSFRIPVGQAQLIDVALHHEPVRASRGDRAGAGIARVLSGGMRGSTNDGYRAPVEINTLLWYTIDVRLFPSLEYDTNDDAHGAYLRVRFNEDGDVKELDGPHFYTPR